jgi:hypothetical protein
LLEAGQAGCLPEELLEAYAFNRAREPEFAMLHEHLLICRVCRSRLSEIEIYIAVMKAAVRGTCHEATTLNEVPNGRTKLNGRSHSDAHTLDLGPAVFLKKAIQR